MVIGSGNDSRKMVVGVSRVKSLPAWARGLPVLCDGLPTGTSLSFAGLLRIARSDRERDAGTVRSLMRRDCARQILTVC